MVNKGRSTGCLTCRARKVKCDETVPTCIRCQTSKNRCGGYRTRFVFIDGKSFRSQRTSPAPSSGDSNPNQKIAASEGPNLNSVLRREVVASDIPHDLHLGAFFDTICRSFFAKKIWKIFELGQLYSLDSARCSRLHRSCTDALAYRYFSLYHHHHPGIRAHAIKPYVSALRELKESLVDVNFIDSVDGILSIVILIHYEAITETSFQNIFVHIKGLARLVEARGPWRYQSPFELFIFEIVRVLIAIFFMAMRKRCFLEDQQWLTVPWALCSDTKSIKETLKDLCCPVGGFWADFETIHQRSKGPVFCHDEEYQSELRELRQRALTHFQAIENLRRQWRDAFPLAYQPTTCHDYLKNFPAHLFGTPLKFQNLARTMDFVAFSHVQHELALIISDIDRALAVSTKNQARLSYKSPLTIDLLPLTHAKRLCRCIPHLLNVSQYGYWCIVLARLYVYCISASFEPGSEESRWLTKLNTMCEDQSGLHEGQIYGLEHISGQETAKQFLIEDNPPLKRVMTGDVEREQEEQIQE